jgi:hypothetical protein
MKKLLKSGILDFIPLVILIGYAINLVVVVSTTDLSFQKVHYAGLSLVLVATVIFFINHKLGVIFLGATILIGLVGFASLSPAVNTTTLSISGAGISFQAIFLLWAIIHAIISGRHYVGIATADYWDDIFDKGSTQAQKIEED